MKSADFANAIYTLYPPFRQWDDVTLKAWTDTIVSECGDSVFSSEIRDQAFKSLTRVKHKEKPPQPATIFQHCLEVRRWLDAEKNKGRLSMDEPASEDAPRFWTESRKQFARTLMSGPMGLQAANEGWINVLDAYCRTHGRLPKDHEIPGMRRTAKEALQAYEDVLRSKGPLTGVLSKLGATVMARRKELETWRLGLR